MRRFRQRKYVLDGISLLQPDGVEQARELPTMPVMYLRSGGRLMLQFLGCLPDGEVFLQILQQVVPTEVLLASCSDEELALGLGLACEEGVEQMRGVLRGEERTSAERRFVRVAVCCWVKRSLMRARVSLNCWTLIITIIDSNEGRGKD